MVDELVDRDTNGDRYARSLGDRHLEYVAPLSSPPSLPFSSTPFSDPPYNSLSSAIPPSSSSPQHFSSARSLAFRSGHPLPPGGLRPAVIHRQSKDQGRHKTRTQTRSRVQLEPRLRDRDKQERAKGRDGVKNGGVTGERRRTGGMGWRVQL